MAPCARTRDQRPERIRRDHSVDGSMENGALIKEGKGLSFKESKQVNKRRGEERVGLRYAVDPQI